MKDHLSILKNKEANTRLNEAGYVVLPYLNAGEVADLLRYFHKHVPEPPNHFYASTHVPDFAFRKMVNQKISDVLERANNQNLDQSKLLGGAMICKPSGGKGALEWHQDWNLVDEQIFRSFNIWIPLVDVDEKNGAIAVLPGSHEFFRSYRGPNISTGFKGPREFLDEHSTLLKMKAGQALIYDHSLWHASSNNDTDTPRPGVVFGVAPKEAPLLIYYKKENQLVESACPPDFFMENDIEKGLDVLPIIKKMPHVFPSFEEKDFRNHYPNTKKTPVLRWLQKFKLK